MANKLRKSDVIAFFDNNGAKVARALAAIRGKYTQQAVFRWGEFVPELPARQLLDHYPELKDLVLDPATGLSLRDMRQRLTPGT